MALAEYRPLMVDAVKKNKKKNKRSQCLKLSALKLITNNSKQLDSINK